MQEGERERDRILEEKIAIYLENLGSDDPVFRWGAAAALGRMGAGEAVPALIEALGDEDWRVRRNAAWALGQIGDVQALPYLARLSRDPVDAVQEMAGEAVRAIQQERGRGEAAI
ncbi:MAG: HEAT repeat domain-containing protein [Methanomicrobiaceae archaeon]|nr:HEAT repeat domain-containing protein [Methanomicrobiaceae archaeon]